VAISRTILNRRLMSQIRLFPEFGSSLGIGPADEDYQIRRKSPLGLRRSIKTGPKRIRSAPRSLPPRSDDETRID
jgi:hypothetical protein